MRARGLEPLRALPNDPTAASTSSATPAVQGSPNRVDDALRPNRLPKGGRDDVHRRWRPHPDSHHPAPRLALLAPRGNPRACGSPGDVAQWPSCEGDGRRAPREPCPRDRRVPGGDVQHAVDHAASDLAGSLKIPGFRGKVPMPVLLARVGKDRLYARRSRATSAAGSAPRRATRTSGPWRRLSTLRAPGLSSDPFEFTATVAVQAKPKVADWTALEVPAAEPEVPKS